MKKVLFIDRDGTLIIEPPIDFQVDSLEKLTFYPGVFQNLSKIVKELDYQLVMVTNQDGLGTQSFAEDDFWQAHNKMMEAFANEGIFFKEVLIDRSFSHENLPTRKPGTAMLKHYINGDYNLQESFVIGDRLTDIQLAENMNCKSIYINKDFIQNATFCTQSWSDIYYYLKNLDRVVEIERNTSETQIKLSVNLDGNGKSDISTGLGFFDHMLEQISRHGELDLKIEAKGDLHVDEHHIIEDVAITLGEAIRKALGRKIGIERYGFLLPMDESLAQIAIDFGGRPWLEWNVEFQREKLGDFPCEMFMHFFKSFSDTALCNLNISVSGKNEHHKAEAIFKAFGKVIKMAVKKSLTNNELPSTKGVL
jgi:imidazoleglycerol-phosphate dehydratase/histidinol-phosphatase